MSWSSVEERNWDFLAPQSFLAKNRFTRVASYNGVKSIEKILKTGTFASCYTPNNKGYEDIPYLDHTLIYKNPSDKITCLVYQPYQNADEIRDEVCQWAESKGLEARVEDLHWYNEATCVVLVYCKGKRIQL